MSKRVQDSSPPQSVRLYTLAHAPGVSVVRGTVSANTFPRHTHRCFVIGAVERGARAMQTDAWATPTAPQHAASGTLFLLNPNQPHSCEIEPGEAHAYCALCVPVENMERAAARAWKGETEKEPLRPRFDHAVVHDPHLSRCVADFGLAVAHAAARAEAGTETRLNTSRNTNLGAGTVTNAGHVLETNLNALLAEIVARHARPLVGPPPEPHPAALRARAALLGESGLRHGANPPEQTDSNGARAAHSPAHALSLRELARRAHMSPFHLQRIFSREFGISPRRYKEQERVRTALELLTHGVPLAEVAQRAGFADQSHLTRVFRRLMGVPPGRFVRCAQEDQGTGFPNG